MPIETLLLNALRLPARSFVRQLNHYGFRKLTKGEWKFGHQRFVRGHPEICDTIVRKAKAQKKSIPAGADSQSRTAPSAGLLAELVNLRREQNEMIALMKSLRQDMDRIENSSSRTEQRVLQLLKLIGMDVSPGQLEFSAQRNVANTSPLITNVVSRIATSPPAAALLPAAQMIKMETGSPSCISSTGEILTAKHRLESSTGGDSSANGTPFSILQNKRRRVTGPGITNAFDTDRATQLTHSRNTSQNDQMLNGQMLSGQICKQELFDDRPCSLYGHSSPSSADECTVVGGSSPEMNGSDIEGENGTIICRPPTFSPWEMTSLPTAMPVQEHIDWSSLDMLPTI